jgi:uncharacterized protein YciU (UPF0263 family)
LEVENTSPEFQIVSFFNGSQKGPKVRQSCCVVKYELKWQTRGPVSVPFAVQWLGAAGVVLNAEFYFEVNIGVFAAAGRQ